ncbi:hypothetical protein ABVT39_001630 [Epinephelus coioides]
MRRSDPEIGGAWLHIRRTGGHQIRANNPERVSTESTSEENTPSSVADDGPHESPPGSRRAEDEGPSAERTEEREQRQKESREKKAAAQKQTIGVIFGLAVLPLVQILIRRAMRTATGQFIMLIQQQKKLPKKGELWKLDKPWIRSYAPKRLNNDLYETMIDNTDVCENMADNINLYEPMKGSQIIGNRFRKNLAVTKPILTIN